MPKKRFTLQWAGTFIELCMGRITAAHKDRLDTGVSDADNDVAARWYENTALLKSLFDADNWWSVDDLDHALGLVFKDRPDLEAKLSKISCEIDGTPVTIDPEVLQLSFYAPEAIDPLAEGERIVCHGSRREAVMHFQAEITPPFDPSLITLSFLHYPDYGYILIDLDYDGHDDVQFTWGEILYLKPRFFGKDHFHDTSR